MPSRATASILSSPCWTASPRCRARSSHRHTCMAGSASCSAMASCGLSWTSMGCCCIKAGMAWPLCGVCACQKSAALANAIATLSVHADLLLVKWTGATLAGATLLRHAWHVFLFYLSSNRPMEAGACLMLSRSGSRSRDARCAWLSTAGSCQPRDITTHFPARCWSGRPRCPRSCARIAPCKVLPCKRWLAAPLAASSHLAVQVSRWLAVAFADFIGVVSWAADGAFSIWGCDGRVGTTPEARSFGTADEVT